MYLQLIRESFTDKATEGKLYINGTFECYTLEDTDRHLESSIDGSEKVYGKTCIPRGEYDVILSYSQHFHKILPELLDVPYFEGIRMHSGNSSEDSEGCVLIGKTNTKDDDDWIGNSRVALVQLIAKLQIAIDSGDEITIDIV